MTLVLGLVLGASAALAQENQSNQTNATPSPAPSPSPTPAPTGRVVILTDPPDGDIFIDDVRVGRGFYVNASHPVGIYRVFFGEIPGHRRPANATLEVAAGNETRLTRKYESLVTPPPSVPKLTVAKEAARPSATVDESIEVILSIKNEGTGPARNVSFNDTLGDCFTLTSGDASWSGALDMAEPFRRIYTIRPVKTGLCFLEPTKVVYFDEVGNRYTAISSDVKILVTARLEAVPKVTLRKEVSKAELFVGDEATVTLTLRNEGGANALSASMSDTIPPCAELIQGTPTWNGTLRPDEERVITYGIAVRTPGLCTLEAASAAYQDARENRYSATSGVRTLNTKTKPFIEQYRDTVVIVAITGGAIGALATIYNMAQKAKGKVQERKKRGPGTGPERSEKTEK